MSQLAMVFKAKNGRDATEIEMRSWLDEIKDSANQARTPSMVGSRLSGFGEEAAAALDLPSFAAPAEGDAAAAAPVEAKAEEPAAPAPVFSFGNMK